MRWMIVVVALIVLPSAFAIDLSDFPTIFIDSATNSFNGVIVLGSSYANALAIIDIKNGITGSGATYPPTATKFDSEVTALTQPSIVIATVQPGVGCDNIHVNSIFSSQQECADAIAYYGMLLIKEINGQPVLFVLGSTDTGTRMAARVLRDHFNYALNAKLVHVIGTPENPIVVYDPPIPNVQGTITNKIALSQDVPSATFSKTDTLIDASYGFELRRQGDVVGTVSIELHLDGFPEAAHITHLSIDGVEKGNFIFEVASDQVIIKQLDYNIENLILQEWLAATGDITKDLTFTLPASVLPTGASSSGTVTLHLSINNPSTGNYDVVSTSTNGYVGNLNIELLPQHVSVPNFDLVENIFYGEIKSQSGDLLSGALTVTIGDEETYTRSYHGQYDIKVSGQIGAAVNFFSFGRHLTSTAIEATGSRRLDFVVDTSPDNYKDEDRDNIPDDFDRCPDSLNTPVDARGCSCEQLDCAGKCTSFVNEYSSRVICAETCYDGIKNQKEEDIDCGGPCDACVKCEIANTCLEQKPQFCTEEIKIANNCALCGCPDGFQCDADGQCYKTIPLKHIQCKTNRYELGKNIDCSRMGATPIQSWEMFMGRQSIDIPTAHKILSQLSSLYNTDEFREKAKELLVVDYTLEQPQALTIINWFEKYWTKNEKWVEERISTYVSADVSGLPSFLADIVQDEIDDEIDKWNVCIKTKEACVVPEIECPTSNAVLKNKPLATAMIKNEFNKRGADKIPSLLELIGTKADIDVNLDPFQVEVASSGICEPARITPLKECKLLIKNGDSVQKADILFITDGFPQKKGRELVEKVIDYDSKFVDMSEEGLFSREPYKSNKQKFNIWYLNTFGEIRYEQDTSKPSSGDLPVESDVSKIANNCPNIDYVVLLANHGFRSHCFLEKGPCFVSLLIEDFPGRLVLHELGHGIGGLTDEYYNLIQHEDAPAIVEDLSHFDQTGINCKHSPKEAESVWGDLVATNGMIGYYETCGGDCDETCATYVRPTLNSIMRYPNQNKQRLECRQVGLEIGSKACIGPPFDGYSAVNEREIENVLERFS